MAKVSPQGQKKKSVLVPAIGCFGCGFRVYGPGVVEAVFPQDLPPCMWRDRPGFDGSGRARCVKAHLPSQVDPVAVYFDPIGSDGKPMLSAKLRIPSELRPRTCNVNNGGQKDELWPYGCNTLFVSAQKAEFSLRLADLVEIGHVTAEEESSEKEKGRGRHGRKARDADETAHAHQKTA